MSAWRYLEHVSASLEEHGEGALVGVHADGWAVVLVVERVRVTAGSLPSSVRLVALDCGAWTDVLRDLAPGAWDVRQDADGRTAIRRRAPPIDVPPVGIVTVALSVPDPLPSPNGEGQSDQGRKEGGVAGDAASEHPASRA